MRSGPGSRYPVLWTYKRRELPVRIEREFDVWRLVEDMDGTKGWVHQATLTGRRTFVITGSEPRTLRADAADSAAAVAILKPGVVGRIKACDANAPWCSVQVGEYRGFLARADFWGVDAGEAVAP
jgi:SH3-like domain-containing protein